MKKTEKEKERKPYQYSIIKEYDDYETAEQEIQKALKCHTLRVYSCNYYCCRFKKSCFWRSIKKYSNFLFIYLFIYLFLNEFSKRLYI